MTRKAAILQSNYIPWKGYFDLINQVDEFILYDDVQYTRRDWRNRNVIKTAGGLKWLTIPVEVKGKYHQRIRDTMIADPRWGGQHWGMLLQNYARAPHFGSYREIFESMYLAAKEPSLSLCNRSFLEAVCGILGITTRITWSWEYPLQEGKSERLLGLCRSVGAEVYVSGPAAKDYLDVGLFEAAGVGVEWMDYSGYPEYRQLHPPFEHGVTVLDLLFNEGPAARSFMKSFSAGEAGAR
jgi:hypothetical protein